MAPETPPTVGDSWGEVGSDSAIEIAGVSDGGDFYAVGEAANCEFFPPKRFGDVDVLREAAQATKNRLMITKEPYDGNMY